MNNFLESIERELEEEKRKHLQRSTSQVTFEKWNGRKIPADQRKKFEEYFEKADVKQQNCIEGTNVSNRLNY